MQRFHRYVDLLREKLAAVQQELANEKDRRNAISAEHFTISQSLLWTQQLLEEARASGEARVQAVEVERAKELVRDRGSSVVREQRHQLELRMLRERSDLLRERATWTSRTLKPSLVACGRSGTKLVRTRFGTTRSGTRRGLSSSLFTRSNRQRLFARR
jgi:CHASE3 domain sensor protein